MKYTKQALLDYQRALEKEAEDRGIQLNPEDEDKIDELIDFIEEIKKRLTIDFILPSSVDPGKLADALFTEGGLNTIYTGSEEVIQGDTTSDNIITVKFLNGMSIDSLADSGGWGKTPQVIENLRKCVQCLESMDKNDVDDLRDKLLIKNDYVPLKDENGKRVGNLCSGATMVANSIDHQLIKDIKDVYFVEIRVQSSTNANYRAYGGFKGINNEKITLYITSLYLKNDGKSYDHDIKKIVNKFFNVMQKLGEGFMIKKWVSLDELLEEKSVNELLEAADFEDVVEESCEESKTEYISDDTWRKIKERRNQLNIR